MRNMRRNSRGCDLCRPTRLCYSRGDTDDCRSFVNGRSRGVIMAEMRQRIDRGDREREIAETIQAMCDIAKDRAGKLQARI